MSDYLSLDDIFANIKIDNRDYGWDFAAFTHDLMAIVHPEMFQMVVDRDIAYLDDHLPPAQATEKD